MPVEQTRFEDKIHLHFNSYLNKQNTHTMWASQIPTSAQNALSLVLLNK